MADQLPDFLKQAMETNKLILPIFTLTVVQYGVISSQPHALVGSFESSFIAFQIISVHSTVIMLSERESKEN
jgi:hypothetical protein